MGIEEARPYPSRDSSGQKEHLGSHACPTCEGSPSAHIGAHWLSSTASTFAALGPQIASAPVGSHAAIHRVFSRGWPSGSRHGHWGVMSTQDQPATSASRREQDFASLIHALRAVGDAASRATSAGGDVRLHVIACRAHHLAARLADREGTSHKTLAAPEPTGGLAESAQALRREVLTLASGQPGIRPVLVQARGLVLLADAIQR